MPHVIVLLCCYTRGCTFSATRAVQHNRTACLSNWHDDANPLPSPQRPRRLLVFVNPFAGARRGKKIWDTVVRPVFDKAGIKCTAVETQHGGHARALITSELLACGWSGRECELPYEYCRQAVIAS